MVVVGEAVVLVGGEGEGGGGGDGDDEEGRHGTVCRRERWPKAVAATTPPNRGCSSRREREQSTSPCHTSVLHTQRRLQTVCSSSVIQYSSSSAIT